MLVVTNAPGEKPDRIGLAVQKLLEESQRSREWGDLALLGADEAKAAIEAILDMAASHNSDITGIYAQQRLCAAIGLKAFTFSTDEAAAIEAHRKAGNLAPGGPFRSTIEAVRDRDLIQQVGTTLRSILDSINDADLVVTQKARQAGITTDLHRLRIALDALRMLSKRIEVLPFIDREP